MTPRPALETVLQTLERDKIIGFVLNGVAEVSGKYGYASTEQETTEA